MGTVGLHEEKSCPRIARRNANFEEIKTKVICFKMRKLGARHVPGTYRRAAVQHNRTPSDLVSVMAMTDQLAKMNHEKRTPPQLARW